MKHCLKRNQNLNIKSSLRNRRRRRTTRRIRKEEEEGWKDIDKNRETDGETNGGCIFK